MVGGRKDMRYVADRLLQVLGRKMPLWFVIFFLLSLTVSVEAATVTYDVKYVIENVTLLKTYCVF